MAQAHEAVRLLSRLRLRHDYRSKVSLLPIRSLDGSEEHCKFSSQTSYGHFSSPAQGDPVPSSDGDEGLDAFEALQNGAPVGTKKSDKWEGYRAEMVENILKILKERSNGTKLNEALQKWDGLVGPRFVGEVLKNLTDINTIFSFFKWAGQQYGYKHTVNTYNWLINLLLKLEKDHHKAHIVYKHMIRSEVKPNKLTCGMLLNAFSHAGKALEACDLLAEMMEKNYYTPTVFTCNNILDGLFKTGKTAEASEFFEKMPGWGCVPDQVTLNTITVGLCKAKKVDDAFQKFKKLSQMGFAPGLYAYNALIGGFCGEGQVDQALELMELMESEGCNPDTYTYNWIIGGLGTAGKTAKAFDFYKKMCSKGITRNRTTYNNIIVALCKGEKFEDARKILREMIKEGFTPSGDAYHCVYQGTEEVSRESLGT